MRHIPLKKIPHPWWHRFLTLSWGGYEPVIGEIGSPRFRPVVYSECMICGKLYVLPALEKDRKVYL